MAYFKPVPTAFPVAPYYDSNYSSAASIYGYEMVVTGNTTFTLSPGSARALCSDFNIVYPGNVPTLPGLLEADIATVGLNGCYPFSIASLGLSSDTMFPVYAVANSGGASQFTNGVTVGCVIATGNNFLPQSFDAFRRVGWVYVDSATGNLIAMQQSGRNNVRNYQLQSGVAALINGNSTTAAAVDLSTGDGVVVPGVMSKVGLSVDFDSFAPASYASVYATGFTPSNPALAPLVAQTTAAGIMIFSASIVPGKNTLGTAASLSYLVANAGDALSLVVTGFEDDMGLSLV